nr:MAG TPA: hypothetical protein [Caudoviricetes sp.]
MWVTVAFVLKPWVSSLRLLRLVRNVLGIRH